MVDNADELTKQFPPIYNAKNKTPKWVGWFNLVFIIAMLVGSFVVADFFYELKVYAPENWQTTLNDQRLLLVVLLYFPVFALFLTIFNYLHKHYLTRELFVGATDYIVAYKESMDLRKIFNINAKRIPPNTKLYIFVYNRHQEASLKKRYLHKYSRGRLKEEQIAIGEAKEQGIELNLDQYPLMSLKKGDDKKIGNVNLIKEISLPHDEGNVDLQQFLPEMLSLKNLPNNLLNPSINEGILTEIGIRITVYSENEDMAFFEVFLNPMETAFCIEV